MLESQTMIPKGSPRETIALDGWWHLAFDEAADWPNEAPSTPDALPDRTPARPPSMGWDGLEEAKESAQVPGAWEQARPRYRGVAWHWRPIVIPQHWVGRVVRLRFEGVRLRAEVFINHRLVGCDMDGHTPFEIEITDYVRPGRRYELFVRVTNPGGARPGEAVGPIRWGDMELPPEHDFGGIWGGVSLIAAAPTYIAALWAMPNLDLDGATAHVKLANRGAARVVALRAEIRDQDNQLAAEGRLLDVALPADCVRAVEIALPIITPRLWSLDDPHLYTVAVTLAEASACDEVQTILGLRRLEAQGGDLYLNGKRLPLRAAVSAGWYPGNLASPSAALAEREVCAARELGLNALILCEQSPTPTLLDAADRAGLLICYDPAQPTEKMSEAYRTFTVERLRRMERRDRHHPCLASPELSRALRLRKFAPVAILPDLPAVAKRYGDRILSGSDGERWRDQARAWQADFATYELGRVYADPSALCAAICAVQSEQLTQIVATVRQGDPDGNLALAAWADAPPTMVEGVVDVYRRPKLNAVCLHRAWQGKAMPVRPPTTESPTLSAKGIHIHDPHNLLANWGLGNSENGAPKPLLLASWRDDAELIALWRKLATRGGRVAWLFPGDDDDSAVAWGEELGRLCGAERPIGMETARSRWVVSTSHPLLAGVAEPGVWAMAHDALLPHVLLYNLPGQTLAVGGAILGNDGLWRMGAALHIASLGAGELLICTLPIVAGAAQRDASAPRLLANILSWLTEDMG